MKRFPCPYLNAQVELTEERRAHITFRHPELLPAHEHALRQTLAQPDEVRRDEHYPHTRLLSRWFDDLLGGKLIVAVVVSDLQANRHWIVTAYLTRGPARGDLEWKRS